MFFVRDKLEVNLRLRERCLQMLEHGLLEEFLDFQISLDAYQKKNGKVLDYMTAPIGYKQLEKLFSEIGKNGEFRSDPRNPQKIQGFFKDFLGANRQYATYQRDYCRTHLKEFQIVDVSGSSSTVDPMMQHIASWLKSPTAENLAKLPRATPGPDDPAQKKLLEREIHKIYDAHGVLTRDEIRLIEKRLRQVFQLQNLHQISAPAS